jgi:hypothetical protein
MNTNNRREQAQKVVETLSPTMKRFLELATGFQRIRRTTPCTRPFTTRWNTQQALIRRGLLESTQVTRTYENPFTGRPTTRTGFTLQWTALGYEVLHELGGLDDWAFYWR